MASIIYLDVDDEITTAAARIRTATETKVALVLPPGSRLATSRINFRLLSREALERNRVLSIVAADPAARAIAASAGLPVHATVAEFEAAIAPPAAATPAAPSDEGPAPTAGAKAPRRSRKRAAGAAVGIAAAGAAEGAADPTVAGFFDGATLEPGPGAPSAPPVVPSIAHPVAAAPPAVYQAARPEMPPPEARARSSAASASAVPSVRSGRGMPNGIVAVLGSLLIVAIILAVIGYVVLPSASVVVTPVAIPIGPVDFVVRADPDATSVDGEGGVIPATRLSQDFTASGEFQATGKKVVQTKSKGNVTFTSKNTFLPVTVPAGTSLRTGSGVAFVTTVGVTIPRASFTTGPSLKNAPISAVRAGPAGNVDPGTIIVLPSEISDLLVTVTNHQPTAGGTREEFPQISQKDLDAALAVLNKDLATQFDVWTAAPDDLPAGATVFPSTGHLGTAVPSVDPASLVGLEQPNFQLAATATGTVVAVDPTLIDQVAAGRIAANVPPEHALKDGSVTSKHDGGQADGDLVDFRVTANAEAIPILDAAALREEIKGKPVAEAKRLLERYGTVTISTWPGFVSSIPTLDARLDLTVTGIDGGISPNPSPSATAP
jgi:hypothetical protein